MKPLFSDSDDDKWFYHGAPRYNDGTVVSAHDWECIAIAFGFSSAAAMFQSFQNADDRREEWLMWNTSKTIAAIERSR